MERYVAVLLLQIVVLAFSFQAGLGIKCYLCNSSMKKNCGDPINRTGLEPRECSPDLYQEVSDTVSKGVADLGQALNLDIPQGQIGASTKFICQKVDIRGESIKCYICTSATDENCKDPINTSKLEPTECSSSGIHEIYENLKKGLKGLTSFMGTEIMDLDIDFACQKTDVSDEEGNTFTVRGCTVAKSDGVDPCSIMKAGQIEKLFKKKVKVDFCDVCDHDLCNGAKHLSSNSMMLITVPCLVLILSLFNI